MYFLGMHQIFSSDYLSVTELEGGALQSVMKCHGKEPSSSGRILQT